MKNQSAQVKAIAEKNIKVSNDKKRKSRLNKERDDMIRCMPSTDKL